MSKDLNRWMKFLRSLASFHCWLKCSVFAAEILLELLLSTAEISSGLGLEVCLRACKLIVERYGVTLFVPDV